MARIIETIIEPSRIEVGSMFKLKVRVEDEYRYKANLITEVGFNIVTEDGNQIRTEWGV